MGQEFNIYQIMYIYLEIKILFLVIPVLKILVNKKNIYIKKYLKSLINFRNIKNILIKIFKMFKKFYKYTK